MAADLPPAPTTAARGPAAADRPVERGDRSPVRALALLALLALALALLMLADALGGDAAVPATWRADERGALVLHAAADPTLAAHAGKTVTGVVGRDGEFVPVDAVLLQHDLRWIPDDAARQRALAQQRHWRDALAAGTVTLRFADGRQATARAAARGAGGLGLAFWALAALALGLAWHVVAVLPARVRGIADLLQRAPYAVMASAQALQLVALAIASVPGPAVALGLGTTLAGWRAALDLVTAAALLHAAAVHPRPHRHAPALVASAWLVALSVLVAAGTLPGRWGWTQAAVLALGAASVWLLGAAAKRHTDALAKLSKRFVALALAGFALLGAVALALPAAAQPALALTGVAVPVWHAAVALLLLALSRLPKTRMFWREAALAALAASLAVTLHATFTGTLGWPDAASLGAAVGAALAMLAVARPWLEPLASRPRPRDAQRMLDHLLRATHEAQRDPRQGGTALRALLAEVFEPAQVADARHAPRRARVFGAGSTLVVPLPAPEGETAAAALVLRHARRLFTPDDARLADGAVELLRCAMRFGDAVEQGRCEERHRLAQDLHDDIGARLLTLMYQAPTPQIEDYLRHTLQDLKTLTRGLAASNRRLGDAAAEWKSDLGQRLEVAHCRLAWSLSCDVEPVLGAAQWSALTRLLRELVSNVIAHAHATRVEVELQVERGRLTLRVSDDGDGSDPAGWSAGLGLAGVRKRVRQLGGQVQWQRLAPHGICCRVEMPLKPPG